MIRTYLRLWFPRNHSSRPPKCTFGSATIRDLCHNLRSVQVCRNSLSGCTSLIKHKAIIKFLQIRLFPSVRLPPILTAGNLVAPPFALHVLFYGSIITSCSILKITGRTSAALIPISVKWLRLGCCSRSRRPAELHRKESHRRLS